MRREQPGNELSISPANKANKMRRRQCVCVCVWDRDCVFKVLTVCVCVSVCFECAGMRVCLCVC